MKNKFKIGDTVRFFRTGLSATGVLCQESRFVPQEWAVEVVPSSIKWADGARVSLHTCSDSFEENIGWWVLESEMGLIGTLDEILGL